MTDPASPLAYPSQHHIGDVDYTFRLMTVADRDKMLAFTRALPERDLLFLRLDITQDSVVDGWVRNIEAGKTISILAEDDGRLAGYGSLHQSESQWTRHLGEIRLLVGPDDRGKGLGGELARQIFAQARQLDLMKLIVRMMSSQQDAQTLFHHLGFIPEALLNDWTIDREGRTHDLIIMSREVEDEA
ncbi:MAG: GNAT family N-acetyltransferase [Acidobacteriota bacterium]